MKGRRSRTVIIENHPLPMEGRITISGLLDARFDVALTDEILDFAVDAYQRHRNPWRFIPWR